MGWKARVPRSLSKAHLKTVLVLQRAGIRFEVEKYFALKAQDGSPRSLVADIFLPDDSLRVECDGAFHLTRVDRDEEKDEMLFAQHGVHTLRLDNRRILAKDGENYVLNTIEWTKRVKAKA